MLGRLSQLSIQRNGRWRSLPLALLIAGCATPAPPAIDTRLGAESRYHSQIELAGRLSVRYQLNGQEQALHGNFTWLQKAEHTTVTLLSPLGQTLATIESRPGAATLLQAGQPARSAADVDALSAEVLGWPLPVSGLRLWLQGFADSADGRRFTATPDSASVTTQDGWRILYVSWQDSPGMAAIPKRIDLERETAQAGPLSMRIVIDSREPR